jgi:hypothetical protein
MLCVAGQDRDLPASPRLGWPGPHLRPNRRLRRLDTLYADGPRIDLLAIEDPDPCRLLSGATALLRDEAPILVVSLAMVAPADRPRVWEQIVEIAGAGYRWHDSWLLLRPDQAARRDALLLEAETVACGFPLGSPLAPSPPAEIAAQLPPDQIALAAVAWGGATAARGAPTAVAVKFDEALPCAGFHGAETDGAGSWWRWSGPDSRAAFALPLPAPGTWRLRLHVIAWGTVRDPTALEARIDGAPLAFEHADGASIRFRPVRIPPAAATDRIRIDLVTPPPRRASADDPRAIGIGIAGAVLELARTGSA